MRTPKWWQHDGAIPRLLNPLGRLYAATTARRLTGPGWRAPVPVLCIGNATAGGSGKTTVSLDIGARLRARGVPFAFLTRGYRGRAPAGRVEPDRDGAAAVGDEALLLAALAPTFVGADRAATARMATQAGARLLVMDDGLQNPGLAKDASLLVIDGAAGIGNGRVIPAGPLREPLAAAAARCQAAILIGPDHHALAPHLPIPILPAYLESPPEIAGQRLFAFAGIGRPDKFFATLRAAGADLAGTRDFPDHHWYSPRDIETLRRDAAALGATLATTQKDAVRLSPHHRAQVTAIDVRLVWAAPAAIEALLDSVLNTAA